MSLRNKTMIILLLFLVLVTISAVTATDNITDTATVQSLEKSYSPTNTNEIIQTSEDVNNNILKEDTSISKNLNNTKTSSQNTITGNKTKTSSVNDKQLIKYTNDAIVKGDAIDIVNITVNKTWNDSDNHDYIRPDNIKVGLYVYDGDYEVYSEQLYNHFAEEFYAENSKYTLVSLENSIITLNDENNWYYKWDDVDYTRDGNQINYIVLELIDDTSNPGNYVPVNMSNVRFIDNSYLDGYDVTYNVTFNIINNTLEFYINNTHEVKNISLNLNKTWNGDFSDDNLPPKIRVALLGNGKILT